MKKSNQNRVQHLLSQMNLDEKLAQIGSCWVYELQTRGEFDQIKMAERFKNGIGQITRLAGASTLHPVAAAGAANKLQKYLVEQTRLGIPAIIHEECCSGALALGGTMYPQMLGLAATFQPELAKAMTAAIRKQLMAIGARQGLAPVLDIGRDARWGRIEETFGEDPTLVSHFGMAYIQGLQGESLAEGVLATGKHFIGHSASLGGLNCAPVQMGRQELFNVYLAPFQAAIQKAGLGAIMNSYPELDGEVVAASRRILTDLLRDALGFDGLVVSDYDAVMMIHNYHYAAKDKSEAACKALQAGIDVELPTVICYGEALLAALETGDIQLDTIDQAVSRHLQKKFELGLFDNPYVDEKNVLNVYETIENRILARAIARQSMVLLKNDGMLPLDKNIATLAVIGPNAHQGRCQLGDYSYAAMKELTALTAPVDSSFASIDEAGYARHDIRVVSILEGIQAAVSATTKVLYATGCDNLSNNTGGFAQAVQIAAQADAVILALGDVAGLTPNCTSGETRDSADLRLPGVQEELARAIIATGKPVAVVLVNGRPYAIPWLADNANAILEAWLPGEEGGAAVAEILFGDANPGGKLPVTFPRSVGQLPVFYNQKPSGGRSNWYVDYVTDKVAPLYPFGYGLSYTSFEYSDLNLSSKQATQGESVAVSFVVSNTGIAAGEEVAQLYVRDEFASTPRPVKELKGYARVELKPGESKKVTFYLPVNQLAFYDNELKLVLEAGKIFVMVGSSSADIRLRDNFEVVGARSMMISRRVFTCPVEIR